MAFWNMANKDSCGMVLLIQHFNIGPFAALLVMTWIMRALGALVHAFCPESVNSSEIGSVPFVIIKLDDFPNCSSLTHLFSSLGWVILASMAFSATATTVVKEVENFGVMSCSEGIL